MEEKKKSSILKKAVPTLLLSALSTITPLIVPVLIALGVLFVAGAIFFAGAFILTAILGLFDISNVPYFYVKNPAPYNIPAVNEPYDRDYQDDVSGFISEHPETEFRLLSNIQFYSENPVFLSAMKIPTAVLDVGSLRIKEGKLYSVTKGNDFRYSFDNPENSTGIDQQTAKDYAKDFKETFGKDGPLVKMLYEKPGDSESIKNLRVDRIPKAYGVTFVRNDKENGYEVRFYLEFQYKGNVDMLTKVMAARARDKLFEKFFYEKGENSMAKAFPDADNSYWDKVVTKDFQDYTETYALPEMEKIKWNEDTKKKFRALAACIKKYRGDKDENLDCPDGYQPLMKDVANTSDADWLKKNSDAMSGWNMKVKCSTDWLQSPYIRTYEDGQTGNCSDDKIELSPNPFLFSLAELLGDKKQYGLDYVKDFADNFGNSTGYEIQKLVDGTVKPSYYGDDSHSFQEYRDIYKTYVDKLFQDWTLQKNFPKYWNTWVFSLYPFNVSQYGISKYVFYDPRDKGVYERYPNLERGWTEQTRTINVYYPDSGKMRLPESADDWIKSVDPVATKSFRKEFLLDPSAYSSDGKVSIGRVDDFKKKVLNCKYPSCALDESFWNGKTELPKGDARASYFYLFKDSDGFFREMVQKGFWTAMASEWKGFLAWFSDDTKENVSKFFNSYAALSNDEAIERDFKNSVSGTERNPLEFLTYYRNKEFDLSKTLKESGLGAGADLSAAVEQDRNYAKYKEFFHEFVPYIATKEWIGSQEVIDGWVCSKRIFSDPDKCLEAFSFLRDAWNSDRAIGYYSAYSKFDKLIKEYGSGSTNTSSGAIATWAGSWVLTGTQN